MRFADSKLKSSTVVTDIQNQVRITYRGHINTSKFKHTEKKTFCYSNFERSYELPPKEYAMS